jgi:hypothetical protein
MAMTITPERLTWTIGLDVCVDDPDRVRVQRDVDGKTWTMPGWLMRLIFLEELKRAA